MSRGLVAVAACTLLALTQGACHKDENPATPSLGVSCEAKPPSGAAPLAVAFLLSVSGADGAFTVAVSYGDGTEGNDPDAMHTYAKEGSYTASFTVATATQSARCAAVVTVGPGASPSPSPEANQPPKAVFKSTPDAVNGTISGTAPLAVRFNMCASSDPDGDLLWFLMDFDGDGVFDSQGTSGANCRKDFVYSAGTFRARVCLHDMLPNGEALHDNQCHGYTVVATP